MLERWFFEFRVFWLVAITMAMATFVVLLFMCVIRGIIRMFMFNGI